MEKENNYSVKRFCELNDIKESTVRNWIFNSKDNGFDKCICRIGKKILISQSDFFNWIKGSKESNGIEDREIVKKYLKINQKILALSDASIELLFEFSGDNIIEQHRAFTLGMIEALEMVLGIEDMKESLNTLNEMIKERVLDEPVR